MSGRLLIVDDDDDFRAELQRSLSRRGFDVTTAPNAQEARHKAEEGEIDVVVTDIHMPGGDGISFCQQLVQTRPDIPVVIITAFGSLESAVAALRAGAFDLITKPFSTERITLAIERAIQHRALHQEIRRLKALAPVEPPSEMLGESEVMQQTMKLVRMVSQTDASVLITGESGSGKELVAREIHRHSRRNTGPLVAINCAALPENLLESELFGHVRGAFTDAKNNKRGLFVEASGGTLFLDEIGELPLAVQAKLLRALETRKVRPVGGTSEVSFDVHLLAATHQDLEAAVEEKRFRDDLFYRINVVHIEVPPLRSRGMDILRLAHGFVERMAQRHNKAVTKLSPEAANKLLSYSWPGNVRELQNSIERAVALASFDTILVNDLPPKIRDHQTSQLTIMTSDPSELVTLEELESSYIRRVMVAVGWNKSMATKVLGIDRSTLYRKLEKYKIPVAAPAESLGFVGERGFPGVLFSLADVFLALFSVQQHGQLDRLNQFLGGERLVEHRDRSEISRAAVCHLIAEAGDENHRYGPRSKSKRGQELDSRVPRHSNIHHDHIGSRQNSL